jgi:hypothetical protein
MVLLTVSASHRILAASACFPNDTSLTGLNLQALGFSQTHCLRLSELFQHTAQLETPYTTGAYTILNSLMMERKWDIASKLPYYGPALFTYESVRITFSPADIAKVLSKDTARNARTFTLIALQLLMCERKLVKNEFAKQFQLSCVAWNAIQAWMTGNSTLGSWFNNRSRFVPVDSLMGLNLAQMEYGLVLFTMVLALHVGKAKGLPGKEYLKVLLPHVAFIKSYGPVPEHAALAYPNLGHLVSILLSNEDAVGICLPTVQKLADDDALHDVGAFTFLCLT